MNGYSIRFLIAKTNQKRGKRDVVDFDVFQTQNYWYAALVYKDGAIECHRLVTLKKLSREEFDKKILFYKKIKPKGQLKYYGEGTVSVCGTDDLHVGASVLLFKNDVYYCLNREWRKSPEVVSDEIARNRTLERKWKTTPITFHKTVYDWKSLWKEIDERVKPHVETLTQQVAVTRSKKWCPAKKKKGTPTILYLQLLPKLIEERTRRWGSSGI